MVMIAQQQCMFSLVADGFSAATSAISVFRFCSEAMHCAAAVHSAFVFDHCAAAMHAILVFAHCAAAMHAILVFEHCAAAAAAMHAT